MNRSAREGKKCKAFELSNGLDSALYKNTPLPSLRGSCLCLLSSVGCDIN